MQTFLPYWDYAKCARVLDDKRLNKQIIEAKVIIDLLDGNKSNQWINHPATRMWQGHSNSLKFYYNCMLSEWLERGKNHKYDFYEVEAANRPEWMWDDKACLLVLTSQRSNLINKLPSHYDNFGWKVYPIQGYYWPVRPKTKKAQQVNQLWIETLTKEGIL